MSESGETRPPRRIDEAAKAAFLTALRAGARREDAAAEAGFSLMGFYGARHRDPEFAAGWTEALAAAPAGERRARAYQERGERGEIRIASANRRVWQRRRRRHVRFTAGRQADFLAHFAISGDACAAAEAAGVSVSTVHRHRRLDREFSDAYDEALDQAYLYLQAEAARLQLAAQERHRAAIATADGWPVRTACPHCGRSDDPAADFDRVMRLLALHHRKPRGVESRFTPGGRRQRWTFEQAIELLDKKMRVLGLGRERAARPAGKEDRPGR